MLLDGVNVVMEAEDMGILWVAVDKIVCTVKIGTLCSLLESVGSNYVTSILLSVLELYACERLVISILCISAAMHKCCAST